MKTSPSKKMMVILFTISISVALEIISQVGFGYFSGFFLFLGLIFILSVFYYVAMLIYAIVIARSTISIQSKLLLASTWLFLVIIGLIPRGHFVTLGALYSVYESNPADIVADARRLMQEYKPMTCFGFPEREPCNEPIPSAELPLSFQKVIHGHVLILDNAVLIEKMGLQGIFRGFVIFPEGKDIWESEPSIQLQKDCNDCWKIRIIEGLYWYDEIESHSFESMFSADE